VDLLFVPYKAKGAIAPTRWAARFDGFLHLPVAVAAGAAAASGAASRSPARNRVPTASDIPTWAESGLPGYEAFTGWLARPGATPREIIAKLNAEAVASLNVADLKSQNGRRAGFCSGDTCEYRCPWATSRSTN